MHSLIEYRYLVTSVAGVIARKHGATPSAHSRSDVRATSGGSVAN